jgi:hypothetical protein
VAAESSSSGWLKSERLHTKKKTKLPKEERKKAKRNFCKERRLLGEGLAGGSSHAARNSDRVELRY